MNSIGNTGGFNCPPTEATSPPIGSTSYILNGFNFPPVSYTEGTSQIVNIPLGEDLEIPFLTFKYVIGDTIGYFKKYGSGFLLFSCSTGIDQQDIIFEQIGEQVKMRNGIHSTLAIHATITEITINV